MAYNKIFRNTIFYTLGNFIPQILGLILLPIFTRYLTPKDYGILNYYTSIITYLTQISIFSINTYLLRHYFDCPNEYEKQILIGNGFVFIIINSLIVHGLAYSLIPICFHIFNIDVPLFPYLPILLLSNIFEIIHTIPLIILRVEEKAQFFTLFNIIKIFLKYIISIIVIVLFNAGLIGKITTDLAVNTLYLIVSFTIIFPKARLKISLSLIRKMIAFSFPYLLSALLFLIIDNSDRFFIERATSLSELGIYSIAATISAALLGFVTSIYRAIEPTVYREHGQADSNLKKKKFQKIYYFAVMISASMLSLFIRELMALMASSKFRSASNYAPILIFAVVFQAITIFYSMLFTAEKKPKAVFYQQIIGAILIISLNYILIPRFGLYGAVAGKGDCLYRDGINIVLLLLEKSIYHYNLLLDYKNIALILLDNNNCSILLIY